MTFDDVTRVARMWPDLKVSTKYDGTPVLKTRGVFVAGLATDEEADADSLVVRCEFEDRELFIEDAPETYYVTDYHARYPVVLVRMSQLTEDALRDLLAVSRQMALAKAR